MYWNSFPSIYESDFDPEGNINITFEILNYKINDDFKKMVIKLEI